MNWRSCSAFLLLGLMFCYFPKIERGMDLEGGWFIQTGKFINFIIIGHSWLMWTGMGLKCSTRWLSSTILIILNCTAYTLQYVDKCHYIAATSCIQCMENIKKMYFFMHTFHRVKSIRMDRLFFPRFFALTLPAPHIANKRAVVQKVNSRWNISGTKHLLWLFFSTQVCIHSWMQKQNICPCCRTAIKIYTETRVLDNYIKGVVENLSDDSKERRRLLIEERGTYMSV